MVTRKTTVKGTGARRRAARPATPRAPAVMEVRPTPVAEVKARLDLAGRKLQVASYAATRFARSSVREVTTAAKASREPMVALWRTMRLTGRHLARDAKAAWHEVVPPRTETMTAPVARARRRPAA
jgi:hypothetical protein